MPIVFDSHVLTGSGHCAVWNPSRFAHVVEESDWHMELNTDEGLTRQLTAGALVPVGDECDGAYRVTIVVGETGEMLGLPDKVAASAIRVSNPYLFKSSGIACVSGIEFVANRMNAKQLQTFAISAGTYAATVFAAYDYDLNDYDFIVRFCPATEDQHVYRTLLQNFDLEPPTDPNQMCVTIQQVRPTHATIHKIIEVLPHANFTDLRDCLSSGSPIFVGEASRQHTQAYLDALLPLVAGLGGKCIIQLGPIKVSREAVAQVRRDSD